jgi:circadian clock protein KaiB
VRYSLRLYVTGQKIQSQRAIANLRELCERELPGRYDMEVIDILVDPDVAERDRILATPMLVRRWPEPVRRIIGDLSDMGKVRAGLDLVDGATTMRGAGANDGRGS